MAIKDIRSNLVSQFLGSEAAAADVTTPYDGVVDNAHYELGVMFSIQITTAGTATSATLVIQESDDPTFATSNTIIPGDENYIGTGVIDVTALSLVPTATASTTVENRMVTCGVFSNLRYLRAALLDVGGATYVSSAFAIQAAENKPTEPPKP